MDIRHRVLPEDVRGAHRSSIRDPAEKKRIKRRHRFLPLAIGTTGGVAMAALAFWFFKKQAEHVVEGRAERYDTAVFDVVHRIDNPAMHRFMEAVTQLGTHAAIGTAAGVTALAMLRQGRRQDAWTVVVSTGGAMAINTILKNVFQRQRPQELARRIKLPKSHSFPSGHSLLSAATYPIVAHHLVQNRSLATQAFVHSPAGATILLGGLSRVYFGVYFPSAVLGGFAPGFACVGLSSSSPTVVERGDRENR